MTEKTKAMLQLDAKGFCYTVHQVVMDNFVSGAHQAEVAGQDPETMFKSLALKSKEGNAVLCLIPVARQLDTKRVAARVNSKRMSFLKEDELFELTGYTHGQTSPLGMKTQLPVFVDDSALRHERIIINGGGIGLEILIDPRALIPACGAEFLQLVKDAE